MNWSHSLDRQQSSLLRLLLMIIMSKEFNEENDDSCIIRAITDTFLFQTSLIVIDYVEHNTTRQRDIICSYYANLSITKIELAANRTCDMLLC